MTVKVIGKSPVKTMEVLCEKCGFKLQFTEADVVLRGVDRDTQCIICPRKECSVGLSESTTCVGHLLRKSR